MIAKVVLFGYLFLLYSCSCIPSTAVFYRGYNCSGESIPALSIGSCHNLIGELSFGVNVFNQQPSLSIFFAGLNLTYVPSDNDDDLPQLEMGLFWTTDCQPARGSVESNYNFVTLYAQPGCNEIFTIALSNTNTTVDINMSFEVWERSGNWFWISDAILMSLQCCVHV